ncbi:MAG: hypothetical protein N4A43_04895 [Alphaproteobacteria bacterium]|nr:hypothetical protein [Alphaproteobacteria bacterium]
MSKSKANEWSFKAVMNNLSSAYYKREYDFGCVVKSKKNKMSKKELNSLLARSIKMEEEKICLEEAHVFDMESMKNTSRNISFNITAEKEAEVESSLNNSSLSREIKKQCMKPKLKPIFSSLTLCTLLSGVIGVTSYLLANGCETKELFDKCFVNSARERGVNSIEEYGIRQYSTFHQVSAFQKAYSKNIRSSKRASIEIYKRKIALNKCLASKNGFLSFYFDSQMWKGVQNMMRQDKDFKYLSIFGNFYPYEEENVGLSHYAKSFSKEEKKTLGDKSYKVYEENLYPAIIKDTINIYNESLGFPLIDKVILYKDSSKLKDKVLLEKQGWSNNLYIPLCSFVNKDELSYSGSYIEWREGSLAEKGIKKSFDLYWDALQANTHKKHSIISKNVTVNKLDPSY